MGYLYLSFMSGNSTQCGLAVVSDGPHVVGFAGAVIAFFVIGASLGSLISATLGRVGMPVVLTCEFACFLWAFALGASLATNMALLLIAVAMGMQNAIHRPMTGASTGKGFITGALFGGGDALARACLGRTKVAEAGANAVSWAGVHRRCHLRRTGRRCVGGPSSSRPASWSSC